ncbi:hypothetical protein JTE90_026284 [Oedothorax gibbosus]|uniref:Uncharacterized protein n=1 Tax=Oedothorax gibbosus TaxID=931172 RepID=A0AAV6U3Y9_9ARAC|nr:hypothetical protein JTE90_026284 [Oedothorax gibbosus]
MFSPMSLSCPISKPKGEAFNYYTCQLGLPPVSSYPHHLFTTSTAPSTFAPSPLKSSLPTPLSPSPTQEMSGDKAARKIALSFAE